MKPMYERIMSACRSAVTRLPGVDDRTMSEIVTMTIRSTGLDARAGVPFSEIIMNERAQASADYRM